MTSFLEYLKKENIIERIIKLYDFSIKEDNERELLNKIKNYLLKAVKLKKDSDLDVLSNIHQNFLNHGQKKVLGEFYTPFEVVNYILDGTGYIDSNYIENKKLIDISCGSGSFIIQAIKRLIHRFLKILKYDNLSDLKPEELENIVLSVKENISGVDINPVACFLCQLNIQYALFGILKTIRKFNEEYSFPIFSIRNMNSLELEEYEKYDFVVGNPPYLFIRNIPNEHRKLIETRDLNTNMGQYDYYQIFLELGLRFLKDGGKLGYILPDSLLALSHRSIARKYIYNATKIKEIYYTGPKFDKPVVSNIIIILQKEKDEKRREKNIINIKLSNNSTKQFYQNLIKKWDYKFLIHLNDLDISILEYLNKYFPKLKDLINDKNYKILLSRGVELGKEGKIIYCKKCKKYYPLPKKHLICPFCKSQLNHEHIKCIIYPKVPESEEGVVKKFLYSINRYEIKENKYIDMSKKGISYKDPKIYENRIIIRQLSQNNLICATYDQDFSVTSQSVYNLKIVQSPKEEFNHFYLLGTINSQLLSYYFIKSFGSYKKLFPRILIEKINQLPIKIPQTERERNDAKMLIIKIKKLLIRYEEKIQNEVDSLVFDLYGISMEQRKYIRKVLKNPIFNIV